MDAVQKLFLEDFAAGQHLPPSRPNILAEEAARFSAEFDPLAPARYLTPPAAETDAPVSSWFVACLGMRMLCEALLNRTAALGAPGIEVLNGRAACTRATGCGSI